MPSSDSIRAGGAHVEITGDDTGLRATLDRAVGRFEHFESNLKNSFGPRGPLKDAFELLAGGGALVGITYAAKGLTDMARGWSEIDRAAADSSKSVGDVVEKTWRMLPVLGQIREAGMEIRNVFTGELTALRLIEEHNKRVKDLLDEQTEAARNGAKAIAEMASNLERLQAGNRVGGTTGFARIFGEAGLKQSDALEQNFNSVNSQLKEFGVQIGRDGRIIEDPNSRLAKLRMRRREVLPAALPDLPIEYADYSKEGTGAGRDYVAKSERDIRLQMEENARRATSRDELRIIDENIRQLESTHRGIIDAGSKIAGEIRNDAAAQQSLLNNLVNEAVKPIKQFYESWNAAITGNQRVSEEVRKEWESSSIYEEIQKYITEITPQRMFGRGIFGDGSDMKSLEERLENVRWRLGWMTAFTTTSFNPALMDPRGFGDDPVVAQLKETERRILQEMRLMVAN